MICAQFISSLIQLLTSIVNGSCTSATSVQEHLLHCATVVEVVSS